MTGNKTGPVGLSRAPSRKMYLSAVLVQRKKKGNGWRCYRSDHSLEQAQRGLSSALPIDSHSLEEASAVQGSCKHLWEKRTELIQLRAGEAEDISKLKNVSVRY